MIGVIIIIIIIMGLESVSAYEDVIGDLKCDCVNIIFKDLFDSIMVNRLDYIQCIIR